MLILVGWHGLSDYEVELPAGDPLSFRHFLEYPEQIQASSTIWAYSENVMEKGMRSGGNPVSQLSVQPC
jgi:IS5 family transposase